MTNHETPGGEPGRRLTHASLFSGIGGAELAAEWMGWQNLFHCETNPFCRKVLNYHFPDSKSYEDITKTDFRCWRGRVGVLTGGFPCQPFSLAGRRKGAADDRYLWPQMLRAVRQIQPRWVLGENVAGILTMVQPGHEAPLGREAALFGEAHRERTLLRQRYTLEEICASLEREGYAVQPYLVPACAVGAPHRRDRVWLVAHRADARAETMQPEGKDGVHADGDASNAYRDRQRERANQQVAVSRCQGTPHDCTRSKDGAAPHPDSELLQSWNAERQEGRENEGKLLEPLGCQACWADFPTQSPVCSGDDGLPGRLAGITFPRWREESIKALGNAWVPQVAYEIFRAIQQADDEEIQPRDR